MSYAPATEPQGIVSILGYAFRLYFAALPKVIFLLLPIVILTAITYGAFPGEWVAVFAVLMMIKIISCIVDNVPAEIGKSLITVAENFFPLVAANLMNEQFFTLFLIQQSEQSFAVTDIFCVWSYYSILSLILLRLSHKIRQLKCKRLRW